MFSDYHDTLQSGSGIAFHSTIVGEQAVCDSADVVFVVMARKCLGQQELFCGGSVLGMVQVFQLLLEVVFEEGKRL